MISSCDTKTCKLVYNLQCFCSILYLMKFIFVEWQLIRKTATEVFLHHLHSTSETCATNTMSILSGNHSTNITCICLTWTPPCDARKMLSNSNRPEWTLCQTKTDENQWKALFKYRLITPVTTLKLINSQPKSQPQTLTPATTTDYQQWSHDLAMDIVYITATMFIIIP